MQVKKKSRNAATKKIQKAPPKEKRTKKERTEQPLLKRVIFGEERPDLTELEAGSTTILDILAPTTVDRKINRIQFLSGNSLKVIAVLTMLIDHLCKIVLQWLLSNYWGAMADNGQMSWERFREIDYFIRFDLQSIGTIAFPLRKARTTLL